MSILFSFLFLAVIFPYYSSFQFGSAQSLHHHPHRQLVKNESESLRRSLESSCGSGNLIDDCWVCDPNWHKHRRQLAKCATGFGWNATGGKNGRTYVVTSNSDDDVVDPVEGTLRFGVIQDEPLWTLTFPYYSSFQFGSAQSLQHHHHRQLVKNESESLRRSLESSCGSGNLIDDCWVCDPNWHKHRRQLAKCATGFGWNATGGKNGRTYVVTSNSDDDVVNPNPGTLRYAVIQDEPLWIKFCESMTIVLKEELIMNSYKTIDGRGVEVVLTGKSSITVQNVCHVIIHGLVIHDMQPAGNTEVRSSTSHSGWRNVSDGDGISIFGSSHVWVDHCTLYHCKDGLINVVEASTDVTISNNLFYDHNEVMLFGHSDDYTPDVDMRVTVAYNVFGEGLNQRIPRCRFGRFEMINNHYKCGWGIYAIGGTSKPTIVSRGNVFYAPDDPNKKEVTFHVNEDYETWKNYDWSSDGDLMLNGAFFRSTGSSDVGELSMKVKSHVDVEGMTANAGAFKCNQ